MASCWPSSLQPCTSFTRFLFSACQFLIWCSCMELCTRWLHFIRLKSTVEWIWNTNSIISCNNELKNCFMQIRQALFHCNQRANIGNIAMPGLLCRGNMHWSFLNSLRNGDSFAFIIASSMSKPSRLNYSCRSGSGCQFISAEETQEEYYMEATTTVMGLTGNSNFTSDLTHNSKRTGQKMFMTPSSVTYKITKAEKVVIKWSNCVDFMARHAFQWHLLLIYQSAGGFQSSMLSSWS